MCDLTRCGPSSDLPLPEVNSSERRLFLKGLASLPIAAMLAHPELARAASERLETVSLPVGDRTVSAALALPASSEKAPTVLLIHEWWGLNDQIKAVAQSLADQGYIALAVDLYNGQVASDASGAQTLMQGVDSPVATLTLQSWVEYLKNHPQSNGKVATLGWCFGGGWSLAASIATPVDATVIYYGSVTQESTSLSALQSPVLGHFGTQDKRINAEMVDGFEAEMAKAGKADQLSVHWYEADHAFANPSSARYDEADAALAWQRTLSFLAKHVKG